MKKKIGKMRGVLLLTFALFLTACGTGGADAQSASYGNSQAAVVERQSGSGENESTAGGSQDPVSCRVQHWDRSDADREKRKDWTGETVRVADNKI